MQTQEPKQSPRSTEKLGFFREHWIEISVLAAGFIAINLVFIAKGFRAGDTLNPTAAGQLGDFVGGYVGTFLALASVVLLTATLRNQRRSTQLVNFEAKYFELLRLHRDNVAEIEVQEVTGRKLFVVLIREYRAALEVVRQVAAQHAGNLLQKQLAEVAYYCLFYGTGPNSSRMLTLSLANYNPQFVFALISKFESAPVKESAQHNKKLAYVPFEGHQSRLGHYFRHLYQAVRYVDQQTIQIDKYEYVKTIRAQLSNHEQALLVINSLTPLGRNWWNEGFMLNYRMVQNIPREFFDSANELDLSSLFPAGYFEWEEAVRAAK